MAFNESNAFSSKSDAKVRVMTIDDMMKKYAAYAVDVHNRTQKRKMELVKVIDGNVQVMAGFMYHITIRVKHGRESKICKVQVWHGTGKDQLVSFEEVLPR
ncbi:hypothetical protein Ancab_005791 [Ancistrocladus abbreviatus]